MVVLGNVGNIYLPSLKDSPLNVKIKNKKIKKNYDNDIHDNDNNDNNNNDNDHNDDDNDDDDDDDDDDDVDVDDDDRPARWCGRGYRGYIYLSILQLDQMKGEIWIEKLGRYWR